MTQFLIAGLGSIGRRHLRNLRALGEHDIVLLRSGRATLPDDDLAGLPVETDLAVALDRWQPRAVLVTNPTALHLAVAVPAARAGCHLLVEKPIANSLDGVDELAAALREGGGKLLVGYQFRFHPGLRKLRDLVGAGIIGRVLHAGAHWGEYLPDWHPWEDYRVGYSARQDLGGGVLLTLSHPFDYLRWLLGEAACVSATAGRTGELDVDVEDSADVTLSFASGALASVHLDYHQRPARHGLELVGTGGTATWDATTGETAWWTPEHDAWEHAAPPAEFERNLLFVEEMRHFLDVVEGRAEPVCTLDDGVRALEIALAAQDAARDGKRVAVG